MRKSEIIETIAAEMEITKVKAEEAVDAIITEVKACLSRGEPVIVRRFGAFSVHGKAARTGRNPKTGEAAEIAARRVVRFRGMRRIRAKNYNGPILSVLSMMFESKGLCLQKKGMFGPETYLRFFSFFSAIYLRFKPRRYFSWNLLVYSYLV